MDDPLTPFIHALTHYLCKTVNMSCSAAAWLSYSTLTPPSSCSKVGMIVIQVTVQESLTQGFLALVLLTAFLGGQIYIKVLLSSVCHASTDPWPACGMLTCNTCILACVTLCRNICFLACVTSHRALSSWCGVDVIVTVARSGVSCVHIVVSRTNPQC